MTRHRDVEPDGIEPDGHEPIGEIDLRAIGIALRRRRRMLLLVALAACVLITILVNVIPPRYTAQTQVLLENQETFFTRPDRVNNQPIDQASQLDPEAVASQVQLMTSRDIARAAIKELGLEGNDEFDPLAHGMNPFKRVLVLLGIMHDATRETRDARIVTAFLDKLVVYSPPKTRVIAIEFTSRDPELAARAANTVATLYLNEQSTAKRETAEASADALAAQIADLRTRLVKADDAREQYRLQTGLLAGTNNMTISGQQLADINTDLSKARTAQADAQAKAQMIRDLLRRGQAADVADVINNDTVRRIAEQRVTYAGELALESRDLLPGHPRIKALQAQVAEYDHALKAAARQAATTLENEATIAGARVRNLETVLAQQKSLAGTDNVDEVHLHALERAADSLKDQLESSTTKYQEALARASSDATPADARIIQRATPPQEASFPKKLPFIVFGTVAALALAVGAVVAGELLGGPIQRADAVVVDREEPAPLPIVPQPAPAAHVWEATTPRRRFFGRRSANAATAAEDDDVVLAPLAADPIERKDASTNSLKSFAAGGLVASILARLRSFGRSAAESRGEPGDERLAASRGDAIGWDAAADETSPTLTVGGDASVDLRDLVAAIVTAHVPGHGLHIVGAGIADESATVVIELARALAAKGRSVLVDLNRLPTKLASLAQTIDGATDDIARLPGLSELLVGDASFAEVIHRDNASRLHFIPTGRREADFRDFDLILDALTATYDFIVLLAPGFPQSDIAKIMAPYADFLVLTPEPGANPSTIAQIEKQLVEAGAREVLVAGRPVPRPQQDVA